MKKCILSVLVFALVVSVFAEEYRLPDGSVYFGEMKDGIFEGHGTQVFQDGAKYTGEFSKGLYNGHGKYESLLYNYDGDFSNGLCHGHGIYEALLYTYDGNFVDGMMEGQGVMKYHDGTVYKGSFKNCEPDGKGRVTFF